MRHLLSPYILLLGLAAGAIDGCYGGGAEDGADPSTIESVDAGAIENGNLASTWQRRRAAYVSGSVGSCSATIVGPRHLLTAAHCQFAAGARAYFYTSSTAYNSSLVRTVSTVEVMPGVSPSSNDFTTTGGDFADIALLTLNSDIPATSEVATMAWLFPGNNVTGFRVGAGRHDNEANPALTLETNDDEIYSSDDNNGRFYTRREEADDGDSGGPFYVSNREVGVLSGSQLVWAAQRNRYSSVPENLAAILDRMSYVGPFTLSNTGGIPASSMARFSTTGDRLCRYICENTSNCRAISWVPSAVVPTGNCYLRETSTGAVASIAGSRTAVRHP